jgi:hypothetical protein
LLVIEAETFDSEGDKKIAVKYGDFTAYIDVTVVSSENCEAAIGDVNYITLKEAVEKADENDVVILKKDIALNECIAVPNDVTITNADGNAFSISRKVDTAGEIPSCYLFDVPIGGSLTLKNVVIDGGAIWNEDMTSNTGIKSVKALIGVTGGNLVIGEGAVLQNNFDDSAYVQTKDAGGAVFANAGTVTIDGGSIIYNKGRFGGAVIVKGTAALVMESGNVSNNFATSSGGAFRSEDKAPITINGGVLENNKSNSEGGTIWISNGKLTINGGTIGKSSAESGGLIMVNDSGTIAINGTDGISGEIKMKVNKAIEINGDVKDSDMTVRLASNPTSDYKLATLGENANAASAVKALTVSGYNSYYKPDGVYITTRDLASDVNMDGSIDKVDAAAVLKIISDIDGDNFNEKRADINGDGNVDMLDVVELLKLTA